MKNPVQHLLAVLIGAAGFYTGGWASSHYLDAGSAEKYIVSTDNQVVSIPLDQFGISKDEAKFVSRMRGPIWFASSAFDPKDKDTIRSALLAGYLQDGPLLNQWASFNSDRERFIAYLMLRVNGSLPVYSVRKLPTEVSELLTSRDGNCGDQAFRLAMVLDLFSIEARTIAWHSKAIEGHWFVDAYDASEEKSYFLDSTNNLMALTASEKRGLGFLDFLASNTESERLDFLTENLIQFPLYYESSVGLPLAFDTWSSNNYVRVRDSTITGLAYELPGMMKVWRTSKVTQPTSVCERAKNSNTGLQSFAPEHCLPTTSLVREAASR